MRLIEAAAALLIVVTTLPALATSADSDVPNVDFSIASHMKTGEQVSPAVHLFKLYCGLGRCSLELLVLNECEPPGSATATFQPKLYTWATWAGTLEVKRIGEAVVEARAHKSFHGRAGTTLRFTYEPKRPFAKRVVGFEAFETDDPNGDKADTTAVEYVPLPASSTISLACPLMAPGLER